MKYLFLSSRIKLFLLNARSVGMPAGAATLDGFHRVVLVQFVDVVGDAGVEGGGSDRVDDGGVMGLLLVALAVGVDEQCKEAAQDGAAQPHGDHVEHVELPTSFLFYATGPRHRNFWDIVGIKATRPALGGVSRTLAAHRKQKDALAGTDLDSRRVALRPV